jgi:hypothetical protein
MPVKCSRPLGAAVLGIGAVGYLLYKRWFKLQLLQTGEIAEEIAADIELYKEEMTAGDI